MMSYHFHSVFSFLSGSPTFSLQFPGHAATNWWLAIPSLSHWLSVVHPMLYLSPSNANLDPPIWPLDHTSFQNPGLSVPTPGATFTWGQQRQTPWLLTPPPSVGGCVCLFMLPSEAAKAIVYLRTFYWKIRIFCEYLRFWTEWWNHQRCAFNNNGKHLDCFHFCFSKSTNSACFWWKSSSFQLPVGCQALWNSRSSVT